MSIPRDRKAEQLLEELESQRLEQDRQLYDLEGYPAGAEADPEDHE